MVFSLTQTSKRQREILEIVLSNGWDYMRRLLTGGQSDEPQIPPPEVLRKILVELGPFYVKLGQLLSTRPDILPTEYIQSFTALQVKVPSVSWTEIEVIIREQCRQPLEELFATIDPEPVAAGSIAQIHRGTLISGEEVALKVQRPGIDRIVAQDSKLIKAIAELVSRTNFGQNYNIVELAEEFTEAVEAELDFTEEARFTDQLRDNLAQSRWFEGKKLGIPKVYWSLSREKLLVLEWLEGRPLLEANLSVSSNSSTETEIRQNISSLLVRVFFQQMYLDGFFHADPHPGNIFYLQDGRLALLDCGMVGRLDPRTQQLLTQMLLAILDVDASGCARLTLELSNSVQDASLATLESDYNAVLRKYYNRSLDELNFSEVFYQVLKIARQNRIRLPGNLGLFAKCLANLEGVARQFNPQINLFEELRPLIGDLFQRQLVGTSPLQSIFRSVLDLKSISLNSPRQIDGFLTQLSSGTLQWNFKVKELEGLRRSIDDSANRLSFSIVLGALIMGAAILSIGSPTSQVTLISSILFTVASLLGLWLIISILRSGGLR